MSREKAVKLALWILLAFAALIVIAAFPHWFASITKSLWGGDSVTAYSDRVSDLERLIGVLLGLSAIYTVALGLSSWASVQTNLDVMKELKERAEKVVKDTELEKGKLENLRKDYETKLQLQDEQIKNRTDYAREIAIVMAMIAIALQRPDYVAHAEYVTEDLCRRREKDQTDVRLNFYLARAYKLLGHFSRAAEVMTWFITAKIQANAAHDSTVADAYYNRACYRSLLWGQTTDPKRKPFLQYLISDDLRSCFSLKPSLLPDLETDADFVGVLRETWFQDTLRELRSSGF